MPIPSNVAAVTPSNTADLPGGTCIGLEVLVAGNVQYITDGGSTSAVYPVDAGRYIICKINRVLTTTTATVQALY